MDTNLRNTRKRSDATRSRRRLGATALAVVAALSTAWIGLQRVQASDLCGVILDSISDPSKRIELDRNAITGVCHDWAQVFVDDGNNNTATSLADAVDFTHDPVNGTTFTGGGSKDIYDLFGALSNAGGWKWTDGSTPDKDDLFDAYAARYTNMLYFGADRTANNGDSQVGFWFFQNEVGALPDGTFGPGKHKDGDVLILSNFTGGGTTTSIVVYRWQTCTDAPVPPNCVVGEVNGTLHLVAGLDPQGNPTQANCLQSLDSKGNPVPPVSDGAPYCATVNTQTGDSPWGFTPKVGSDGHFAPGEFYEGGINLAFLHLENECFASFLAETRSSQSPSAVLKDFVLGQFQHCNATVETTPQGSASASGPFGNIDSTTGIPIGNGTVYVRDKAVLTITGLNSWSGSVEFYLCSAAFNSSTLPLCTTGGDLKSTVAVSGTAAPLTVFSDASPNSATVLNTVGKYCWRAVFIPTSPASLQGGSDARSSECFIVTPVQPGIVTAISPVEPAGGVPIGTVAHDTSSLTGTFTSTAGGTVTYSLFNNSSCSASAGGLVADLGTKTVTGGIIPPSDDFTFNNSGDFWFYASYSGDANNLPANSGCASEPYHVKPNHPDITTLIIVESGGNADGTVNIGAKAHDTSSLTNATATAGGTVTYSLFNNPSCDATNGGLIQDLGTKTVTNHVPAQSATFTFNTAGTFYFYAVYSGDTNNDGANSGCAAEPLVVKPNAPTPHSTPVVQVKDTLTVSGFTSNATGNVLVGLYKSADCTTDQVGTNMQFPLSTAVNGTLTAETLFVEVLEGNYSYKISYAGDTNNVQFSNCEEHVGVTITSLP
jgi:hypothetical protein